jgi:hypothetical protein
MTDDHTARKSDYLDIALLIGTRRPLPVLYRAFQEVLLRRMPAKNMYIALLDDPEHLRFPFYADEIEPENEYATYEKGGMTAYVMDTGRTAWVGRQPDLLERVEFIGPRPVDWIGVPMRDRSGAVFGVLTVQTYREEEKYTEDNLAFLEFTAVQAALAIQMQHLDRDIAIARIAALMDETTDLDELYPRLHAIVASLIPSAERSFVIARIDDAAGRFRPVYWRDDKDDWGAVDWPLDRGMSGYICQVSRKAFIYEEGRTPPPPELKRIGAPPLFWLGAPLYSGARIIGVVFTQTYEPDKPITREDEATLVAICPHIAQAIGRTEFFGLNYRVSPRV